MDNSTMDNEQIHKWTMLQRTHLNNDKLHTAQKTPRTSKMDTFSMNTIHNPNIPQVLQAYGEFFHTQTSYGMHGYFLSFMFSHIPGSDNSRMLEMKKHLGW